MNATMHSHGPLTLRLFGQRKRLPITATFTGGVILNNSSSLFVATFFGGVCLRLQPTHMRRLNLGDDCAPHTAIPKKSDTNVLP